MQGGQQTSRSSPTDLNLETQQNAWQLFSQGTTPMHMPQDEHAPIIDRDHPDQGHDNATAQALASVTLSQPLGQDVPIVPNVPDNKLEDTHLNR